MSEPTSCRVLLLPWLLLATLCLSGCATSPFAESGYVAALGPADALRGDVALGQRVLWGGQIVGVGHSSETTEMTVVALPLDGADRPRASAPGGVRFVVRHAGFLEPVNYAPGRLITVLGRYEGLVEGAVGEYMIEQPLLDARQIELWPVRGARPQTQVGIGVGIRL